MTSERMRQEARGKIIHLRFDLPDQFYGKNANLDIIQYRFRRKSGHLLQSELHRPI